MLLKKIKRPARSMTTASARKRKIRFFAKPKEQAEKHATTCSDSNDDDIPLAAICDDDCEVSNEEYEVSSISSPLIHLQLSNLKEDDYILVRFTTKSIEKFHIRQVLKVDEKEQEIYSTIMTRMKSHQAGNTFHFSKLEDISTHGIDVVLLPQPVCGTTFVKCWTFSIRFFSVFIVITLNKIGLL